MGSNPTPSEGLTTIFSLENLSAVKAGHTKVTFKSDFLSGQHLALYETEHRIRTHASGTCRTLKNLGVFSSEKLLTASLRDETEVIILSLIST